MANRKRFWTAEDYINEAREFVACYGPDHCWDEFVDEYCSTFESAKFKRPDPYMLISAIVTAKRENSKSQIDGDLIMDDKQEL